MVPRGGGLISYNQPRSCNRLVGLHGELAVKWNLGQINRIWFTIFNAGMETVWPQSVLSCDREAGAAADDLSVLVNPLIFVLSSVYKNTYIQHIKLFIYIFFYIKLKLTAPLNSTVHEVLSRFVLLRWMFGWIYNANGPRVRRLFLSDTVVRRRWADNEDGESCCAVCWSLSCCSASRLESYRPRAN